MVLISRQTTMTKKSKNNVLKVGMRQGDTELMAITRGYVMPELQAAVTIQKWEAATGMEPLLREILAQTSDVDEGSMKRPEAMLVAQAHTLDQLFNNLARRAHGQEYMPNFEAMLRLALKAQSQCRATIETLAAIKNPPVIFAKQANFSGGHQQINNGTHASRVGQNKNQQNELLAQQDGSTKLDTGATGPTSTEDKAMAALD
jgi:hypothetical protein